MNRNRTVAVLIPTYRPNEKFTKLLEMLQRQSYPIEQIIVMNTEESDWNGADGQKIKGLEVHHITREEFDHGNTRHLGMGYAKTDVCICMTHDAVPADDFLIEELMKVFCGEADCRIAVVSARQLPEQNAQLIERYTRSFNYPDISRVKTLKDLPELGIKTYFSSNVCAAYDMEVYRKLGGFIRKTIFNEDMIYAAKAIQNGYGIAYEARARVIHSHNFSNMQQLRRNFDLAVSQAEHPEVFAGLASEGEGIRLVKQTASYLIHKKKAYLLPELVVKSGFKYLGYQLGKHYRRLPRRLVKALTMNQNYWR